MPRHQFSVSGPPSESQRSGSAGCKKNGLIEKDIGVHATSIHQDGTPGGTFRTGQDQEKTGLEQEAKAGLLVGSLYAMPFSSSSCGGDDDGGDDELGDGGDDDGGGDASSCASELRPRWLRRRPAP
ncbi:MAG: hypothetical protein ABIQ51_06190 [Mesorhizobium sp.]